MYIRICVCDTQCAPCECCTQCGVCMVYGSWAVLCGVSSVHFNVHIYVCIYIMDVSRYVCTYIRI